MRIGANQLGARGIIQKNAGACGAGSNREKTLADYGDLLRNRVARHRGDIKAIPKRVRDRLHPVGRRHEENVRQVEGKLYVGIAELSPLDRIENLKEDVGSLAAQLVDLVEDEHRPTATGTAEFTKDGARLRGTPRTVVPAKLGAVVPATAAEPRERPAGGRRDRLSERSLPDAGRASQTQRRALLANSTADVFHNGGLRRGHGRVTGVKSTGQVDPGDNRRRTANPGKVLDPLDPAFGRLGIHGAVRRGPDALPLLTDSLSHNLRETGRRTRTETGERVLVRNIKRPGNSRGPAASDVVPEPREELAQDRDTRLVRVSTDYPADKVRINAQRRPRPFRTTRNVDEPILERLARRNRSLRNDPVIGKNTSRRRTGTGRQGAGGRLPARIGPRKEMVRSDRHLLALAIRSEGEHENVRTDGYRDRSRIGSRSKPEDSGNIERDSRLPPHVIKVLVRKRRRGLGIQSGSKTGRAGVGKAIKMVQKDDGIRTVLILHQAEEQAWFCTRTRQPGSRRVNGNVVHGHRLPERVRNERGEPPLPSAGRTGEAQNNRLSRDRTLLQEDGPDRSRITEVLEEERLTCGDQSLNGFDNTMLDRVETGEMPIKKPLKHRGGKRLWLPPTGGNTVDKQRPLRKLREFSAKLAKQRLTPPMKNGGGVGTRRGKSSQNGASVRQAALNSARKQGATGQRIGRRRTV